MTVAQAISLAPPSRARRMRDRQRQIELFEQRLATLRRELAAAKGAQ